MTRVLSLRGGGVRGYATAILLAELERATGKACSDMFDLMVGTSAGAIVATGLALRMPANALVALFELEGASIFAPRMFSRLRLQYLGHPRYKIENLRLALDRHFLPETKLAHVFTKLMVTSTRYRGLQSRLWKSWKDPDMSAVDVVCSSAAAPTYFGPVTISGFSFCDGGVWSNNPAPVAAVEAKKLYPGHSISLIDIACPDNKSDFDITKGGYLDILPHLSTLFMGSGEDGDSYIARQIIGSGRMLSIEPDLHGASPDIGNASGKNLYLLRLAAEFNLERNVADIIRTLGY